MQSEGNSDIRRASGITCSDMLEARARVSPDSVAIEFRGTHVSFAELNALANEAAGALRAYGAEPGVPVCVVAENSLDYVVLIYACAKIGVPLAGINTRLAASEIAALVAATKPHLLFVSRRHKQLVDTALKSDDSDVRLERIIEIGSDHAPGAALALCDALRSQQFEDPRLDIDHESIMLILYTSGTTGLAKGVMMSHRAIMARAAIMSTELRLTANDAFVAWMPLFHMSSSDYMVLTHARGGMVLLLEEFAPAQIVEFAQREQIGWLMLMPGTFDRMIAALESSTKPLKGVRYVGSMADLTPQRTIATLANLLDAPFVNTFGTTEVGTIPAAVLTVPRRTGPDGVLDLAKHESVFYRLRIEKDTGADAAPGEVGEVLVKGPSMFSGYWNDREATAAAFDNGWFRSGDVVRVCPGGRYEFVGRAKYLIKTGGENVYPAEVEKVLERHDAVEEAIVVRAPDSEWGERVVGFVRLRTGEVSAEDLRIFCRSNLARYKVPKEFFVLAAADIRRNVTGKVDRSGLEELRRQHDERPVLKPLF